MHVAEYKTVTWHTFTEGYRARIDGIPKPRNPYKLINPEKPELRTLDWQEWDNGWSLADKDLT
jgi:hypothetical protein